MRIFLTGKNGQVGFELQRALAPLGTVRAVGQAECDLADEQAIRRLIREWRPEIIVNPAAYTAVDRAESEPKAAFAVNSRAPEVIGEEAAKLDVLVVHYCTDYVFDGHKAGAYTEADIPHPLGVYGKSKAAGTQALSRQVKKHLVFRTSWVFGAYGNNFAKTILRLAGEREELKVVSDQFGAPTSAALLADVTAQILGQYRRWPDRDAFPYGLYNLAATGETTWCDYAKTVVATAWRNGRDLKLQPENILPITTAEYPVPAARPANSRLATDLLRHTFGLRLPSWQEGLEHVLQQLHRTS
ncbi:MAG: dTDP-4-dehydrorhamnose reductase [Desulfobulbus sp.]|uniref:dTDP-4-dehydrorhamnose reductase n=1 Tax=Desulfobulbus sp. TaxID=895 RepID=UPI0028444B46|nr:dTDP-4-dehydrorhamnose reductase [Desulfobulbus sp.]MDR2551074.1 dTDP-4-dehydrorhamnose reductase [Desulfobulbus sp.]